MALFGSKKKTEKREKKAAPAKKAAAAPAVQSSSSFAVRDVIKHARITEKASEKQALGVYVFDVVDTATKRDIIRSVQALYKVTPAKVRVANMKPKEKRNMRTGRSGMRGGGRKAYIYLKAGETITL